MQIANDQVARALAYLVLITGEGGSIFSSRLDEFGERSARSSLEPLGMFDRLAFGIGMTPQRPSVLLADLGWAAIDDNSMATATDLGRLVSRGLARSVAQSSDEPISVIIDPEDPLAYARVLAAIETIPASLLVDPYLTAEGFFEIAESQNVSRVLTADRKGLRGSAAVRKALAVSPHLELRILDDGRLHDRLLIGDDSVLVLGSSLNSIATRPGVVVPLEGEVAKRAMTSAYEGLWRDAELVEPDSTVLGPTGEPN